MRTSGSCQKNFAGLPRRTLTPCSPPRRSVARATTCFFNWKTSPSTYPLYIDAFNALNEFYTHCSVDHGGSLAEISVIAERLVQAVVERPQEILPRVTVPYYADFTLYHSVNVCVWTVSAARFVIDDLDLLTQVAVAALVHDLGQALLPDELLYKGGPLTRDEARQIVEHPVRGAEMLFDDRGVRPVVVAAVFGHHTKETAGYPQVLSTYPAGPVTQLLEVVDVFEALTAHRPHKKAITAPQAFARLFADPSIQPIKSKVDLLSQTIGFHPVGSRVRTKDGKLAVVCGHQERDPSRPLVRLVETVPDGDCIVIEQREAVCGDLPWSPTPDKRDARGQRALPARRSGPSDRTRGSRRRVGYNTSSTAMKLFPLFRRWFFLLTGGYVLLCVVMALIQRRLQYLPTVEDVPFPSESWYHGLEDVTLDTADGFRLRAWYWPGTRPITLVIFHGNGGNRLHRLDWAVGFHRRGFGVFLLDYRGYGGSEGSPTEEGLYLDGEATVRWLEAKGAGKLVYVGESLGSGVAVEMAVRQPPAALIVQSGFSSAVDVARNAYPFLPVGLLMKDRYENADKIGKVKSPCLFIHGEKDRIVPVDLGRRLFERASEPKEIFLLPAADHNHLIYIGGKRYYDRVETFLVRYVEGEGEGGRDRGGSGHAEPVR